MLKRRISLLLLLVMMLSLTTACGEAKNANGSDNDSVTTEVLESKDITETEVTREPVNLPDNDYDGYEFRILARNSTSMGNSESVGQNYWSDFGFNEDRTGEPINDTVHSRNTAIEEKYSIKISTREIADVGAESKKIITAGEDQYDIIMPFIDNTFLLAEEKYVYELGSIPYLDLSKPWWDNILTESLSMANKIYVATGDISMDDEELNWCDIFNKSMIANYNLENPYDLVREGKWTIDKMRELGKKTTEDIDGNGVLDHKDRFGFGNSYSGGQFLFTSADCKIAELNSNGEPELTIFNDRTNNVMDKIIETINDKEFMIWADNIVGVESGWKELRTMFKDNRMTFFQTNIYAIKELREMMNDFGIIPGPKYDEAQENYAMLIATHACPGVCIPVTIKDTERTGLITEALAYASDAVSNAYYDVTLASKYMRDVDSLDMLKIIFSSRVYDIGKIFGWGDFIKIMTDTTKEGKGFASTCEANRTKAETAMKKTYDLFID